MDYEWMKIFTIISMDLITIYISFYFFDRFLVKTERSKPVTGLIFILLVIVRISSSLTFSDTKILALASLVYYALMVVVVFDGSMVLRIASGAFIVVFGVMTEGITVTILSFGAKNNLFEALDNLTLFVIGAIISKLLMLLLIRILIRLIKSKQHYIAVPYLSFIISIPIISIALVVYLADVHSIIVSTDSKLLFAMFGIFYINVIAFAVFEGIIRKSEENERYRLENEKFRMEKEYYENVMNDQEYVKAIKHDMKNTMISLQTCIKSGDYSHLNDILGRLNDELDRSDVIHTGNVTVDAVVNNKLHLHSDKKIDVTLEARLPEVINIDDLDICVLLGNAIDNAIEACDRLDKDKFIDIKMKYDRRSLFISVVNSCNDAELVKSQGRYLSLKPSDQQIRGFGLKNIERIIKSYEGNLTIKNENNHFTIAMVIPELD